MVVLADFVHLLLQPPASICFHTSRLCAPASIGVYEPHKQHKAILATRSVQNRIRGGTSRRGRDGYSVWICTNIGEVYKGFKEEEATVGRVQAHTALSLGIYWLREISQKNMERGFSSYTVSYSKGFPPEVVYAWF